MRLALAASSNIGIRAGRAILGTSRLGVLGVYRSDVTTRDERAQTIESLDGWDALVTDAPASDPRVREAARLGMPIVTNQSLHPDTSIPTGSPMVASSSARSGLPAALAVRMMARFDTVRWIKAAVTVDQRRIKREQSALFPDPVGPLWCEAVSAPVAHPKGLRFFDAPYEGPLLAIAVQAEGRVGARTQLASDGIVDDPSFLEAVALAGGAVMLLNGASLEGRIEVQQRADDYLAACTSIGLGVASFKDAS